MIEGALTHFPPMERNRDDEIPVGGTETWLCCGDQEVGKERFEPGGVIVFIAVDRLLHDAGKLGGGTGYAEVNFLFATVEAFERDGDIARERKSTAFAERWFDPFNSSFAGAAGLADVALGVGGALFTTDLAELWIEESKEGICKTAENGKRER